MHGASWKGETACAGNPAVPEKRAFVQRQLTISAKAEIVSAFFIFTRRCRFFAAEQAVVFIVVFFVNPEYGGDYVVTPRVYVKLRVYVRRAVDQISHRFKQRSAEFIPAAVFFKNPYGYDPAAVFQHCQPVSCGVRALFFRARI